MEYRKGKLEAIKLVSDVATALPPADVGLLVRRPPIFLSLSPYKLKSRVHETKQRGWQNCI
jgi:hypothetical protein